MVVSKYGITRLSSDKAIDALEAEMGKWAIVIVPHTPALIDKGAVKCVRLGEGSSCKQFCMHRIAGEPGVILYGHRILGAVSITIKLLSCNATKSSLEVEFQNAEVAFGPMDGFNHWTRRARSSEHHGDIGPGASCACDG